MRELDVECMKKLGEKVNVIPVIGKADTMGRDEVEVFKKRVSL